MDCLAELGMTAPGPKETNDSTTKASGHYAMTLNSALERHWVEGHKKMSHTISLL